MNAIITDIKKFAVHDGDGIRTTVFFKGCTLRCVWCHNPETISTKRQIAFYKHKCVLCGKCMDVCNNHRIIDGKHLFDRQNCVACAKCTDVCMPKALCLYGEEVCCEDICDILLEDKPFYDASNGGITLSGGECLLQSDACRTILIRMKEQSVNTAIDTCGNVPWENIEKIIDYTDVFLFDLKAIDEKVHMKCTGASSKLILENLKRMDKLKKKIEIRIPYVPDYNDGEMDRILRVVLGLENPVRVRILPYHDLARSKYLSLGLLDTMPKNLPKPGEIEAVREKFRQFLT